MGSARVEDRARQEAAGQGQQEEEEDRKHHRDTDRHAEVDAGSAFEERLAEDHVHLDVRTGREPERRGSTSPTAQQSDLELRAAAPQPDASQLR